MPLTFRVTPESTSAVAKDPADRSGPIILDPPIIASEALLRETVDALLEGVLLQDTSSRVLLWNPAVERMLGLTSDQLAGRTPFDARWRAMDADGNHLPGHHHPIPRALVSGLPLRDQIMGVMRADGTRVWLSVNAAPLFHPGESTPYAALATMTDITAQREASRALREIEARFTLITQHVADALVHATPAGVLLYATPSADRILGRRVQPGDPLVDEHALHPEDHDAVVEAHARMAGGEHDVRVPPYRLRRDDATYAWIEASGSPVEDAFGVVTSIIWVLRDVSETRRVDEQLHLSSKMQAVGFLAGGVAHDFNNVLTIIQGSTEVLLADAPSDHHRADLERIAGECERARGLTKRLLGFTRQDVPQIGIRELDSVIEHAIPVARRMLRRGIGFQYRLASNGAHVLMDVAQLELAVMNLVSNARDAMPHGGYLSIETSDRVLTLDDVGGYQGLRPGRYACIAVADTGVGMTPEVQAHLFEPFFTTKSMGKGSGLGLATVYGVVQRAGGAIMYESEPNVGTRFEIFLPYREQEVAPPISVPSPRPNESATHLVLVVDDEPGVRLITKRILELHGYRTLVAASGEEAVHVLQERADEVSVVITDFAMPEMNGRALLEEVWQRWPDIRTILMSGFTADEVTRTAMLHTTTPFLAKPYLVEELLETIQVALAVADDGQRQA